MSATYYARPAAQDTSHVSRTAEATPEPRESHDFVAEREISFYERFAKPVIDRVGAAVILVLLVPVLLAIALAVLLTLGRPLFYTQERTGKDGKSFRMIKFRTMRPDRRQAAPDGFVGTDRRITHKTPEDPRHTPVGRLLRKFSLDELPQLWNVLRGELSLIGPRPELTSVVEARYDDWQHARHAVKPGLTGLWQVTARDEHGQMHRHVNIDLRYVRTVSPLVDLKIALLTLPVVAGFRLAEPLHDPKRIAPDPEFDRPELALGGLESVENS